MNVNIEKEAWKNEVLDSLNGMRRAEPSPFLFTRIEARLYSKHVVTPSQLKWAAFALAVILFINVAALVQHRSSRTGTSNEYSLSNFTSY